MSLRLSSSRWRLIAASVVITLIVATPVIWHRARATENPMSSPLAQPPWIENLPPPPTSSSHTPYAPAAEVLNKASNNLGAAPEKTLKPSARLATPTPTPTSRTIRVGLSTQGAPIQFWSQYAMTITDVAQPGRRLNVGPRHIVTVANDLPAQIVEQGRRWNGSIQIETSGRIYRAWQVVRITPAGVPTRLSTSGANPRWERAYRGSFEIAPQSFSFEPATHLGRLRLVNIVSLEEYLKGVVPWEMTYSAPLEALKA
ncbi:MAG: SpoIID/LytB domain-containing protein, partial [Armatimonadota bacterium]|nr:SpoIID/LytB domain-containing protein [Armatimonadota bacterium]